MDENLLSVLRQAGKKAEVVRLGNGSDVILLPYGGRVLGLFVPGDSRNFYWTNPALREEKTAREFFGSDRWQNTGGDRTWLAPEIDFFFPNFPDTSVYHQPREFDAKEFRCEKTNGVVRLTTAFTIGLSRQIEPVRLRLTKAVESVANPLRHEPIFQRLSAVAFAGYGLRTTLEFSAPTVSPIPVGLWHLIQMPHGGEMILPTYSAVKPTIVFGQIPSGDLRAGAACVRYRMRAAGEQKIGLRAVGCTGRIGYYRESGEESVLVLRNFFVNPSGEYVDAPATNPSDVGYAVQACNIDSGLGTFNELEYHIPAIGVPGHPARSEDFAQVWAYRGPRDEIALIARTLLGVSL